ncbi:MAG: zf-HC2 domain-containing protein [Clostridia bacterium]|nr:zf-HC2 domain-containing protein [Clostridia bacterium]
MKLDCEVIRDLLPLYADQACSEQSRALVNEHLLDCADCRDMLQKLKENEIENGLKQEKDSVLQYGIRQFKKRTAAVGSAVSGAFLIPILICLYLFGSPMGWIDIVLASLCVAASVSVVPIVVHEDKFFWTFCAFTASLMLLLGVVCIHGRGTWFWIASSASLFGLAAVGLPFMIKARPMQKLLGGAKPWVVVTSVDIALFINMMNMISARGKITIGTVLFSIGVFAGIGLVIAEIMRRSKKNEKE